MSGSTRPGGTGSAASKTCTMCGEDVSSKPRTKDAKGRYFCKPCYDTAIADKHARRSSTPLPKATPVASSTQSLLNDDAIGLEADDAEVNSVLANLLGDQPAHAAHGMICPACRTQLQPGGFICTKCGFNLQTNEHAAAVKVKNQRAAGGVAWPMIVGIISMIFGIGGIAVYGLLFLSAIRVAFAASFDRPSMIALALFSLLFWLTVWLTRDGWRVLKRNPDGVKWIRFWALAKGLMFGTCLGMAMSIPPGPLQDMLDNAPGAGNLTVADIKSSLLISLLFYLAWPAFILIFFFIPRIQSDVEAWE